MQTSSKTKIHSRKESTQHCNSSEIGKHFKYAPVPFLEFQAQGSDVSEKSPQSPFHQEQAICVFLCSRAFSTFEENPTLEIGLLRTEQGPQEKIFFFYDFSATVLHDPPRRSFLVYVRSIEVSPSIYLCALSTVKLVRMQSCMRRSRGCISLENTACREFLVSLAPIEKCCSLT